MCAQYHAVDPEIAARVKDAPVVRAYLEELQSTRISDGCIISSTIWYYIVLISFTLPSVWNIITLTSSLSRSSLPDKLFFDYCVSSTDTAKRFSLMECIYCANNRSSVYSALVPIPDDVKSFGTITILVSVVVGLMAVFVFSKASLAEAVAHHMLEFGVVVQSPFNLSQLWPTMMFTLLFALVAGLNMFATYKMSEVFQSNIIVGLKDRCEDNIPASTGFSHMAKQVVYARFNEGNPSARSTASPKTAIDAIKLLVAVLLPFVPLISRFWQANTTTYSSRLTLDALVRSQHKSSGVFMNIKYQLEEADLMKHVKEYAERFNDTEGMSIGNTFRHLLVGSCSFTHPLPESFGLEGAWGNSLRDVQQVLTIAKRERTLCDYQSVEADGSASPKMPLAQASPVAPIGGGLQQPLVLGAGGPPPMVNMSPAGASPPGYPAPSAGYPGAQQQQPPPPQQYPPQPDSSVL